MRILVIGGTYFLGKVFLEFCDNGEHEFTMLNRGTRELTCNKDGHIELIKADRHDMEALKVLAGRRFDVIVDFCAYQQGDIERILQAITDGNNANYVTITPSQYIFISTVDVYKRGTKDVLNEDSPLETRDFGGEEGSYILGKAALEKELVQCAASYHMHSTSIRPSFIYGPDNYAPREGLFFFWTDKAGQVILPENGGGNFQMVYVKDLAKAIVKCIGNKEVFDSALNICGPGMMNYEWLVDCIEKAAGKRIERIYLPVKDILQKEIPLPFPLTNEESESYADSGRNKLGIPYTTFEDGLKETYLWYQRTV